MKKLYFLILALCFGLTTGYAQVVSVSSEDTLVNPTDLFLNIESSGSTTIGIGVSHHNGNYVWFDAFPLIDGTNKISWKNTYPLDTTVFVEITEFGTGAKFYTQFVVDMPTPKPDSIYFINPKNGSEIIDNQKFTIDYYYTGSVNAFDKYYMKYKLNAEDDWYTDGKSYDFQNWADVYKISPKENTSTIDLAKYPNIDTGYISLALVEKTTESFKIIDSIQVKVIPTPPHFISIKNLGTEYYVNDTIYLEWKSFMIDSINVLISIDGGLNYSPVLMNQLNAEMGMFVVPNTLPSTVPSAKIKIESAKDNEVFITSSSFKMYDFILNMEVTNISPSGDLYTSNAIKIDFSWNGEELKDLVFLEYSLDSGITWNALNIDWLGTKALYTELYIVKNGTNSIEWFLDPSFPTSDKFMFRFIEKKSSNVYGTSEVLKLKKGASILADKNEISNYPGEVSTLNFNTYNVDSCNIYVSYDSINYTLLAENLHVTKGLNSYSFVNAKIDESTEKYTFYVKDANNASNVLYMPSYDLWNKAQSVEIVFLSKNPIKVGENVNMQITYTGLYIESVSIAYKNQKGGLTNLPFTFPFIFEGFSNGQLLFDDNVSFGEVELLFLHEGNVIGKDTITIVGEDFLEITSDFTNKKYYQGNTMTVNTSSYGVDSVAFLGSIDGGDFFLLENKKIMDGYNSFNLDVPHTQETIEFRLAIKSINKPFGDTTEIVVIYPYADGVQFIATSDTMIIEKDSIFSLSFNTTLDCIGKCDGYVILPGNGSPEWKNRFTENGEDYFWKGMKGSYSLKNVSVPAAFLSEPSFSIYLIENNTDLGTIIYDSITVIFKDVTTGVESSISSSVGVYPNPSAANFTIDVVGTVNIMNAQGIVMDSFYSEGVSTFGDNYESGVYTLSILSQGTIENIKIIKE